MAFDRFEPNNRSGRFGYECDKSIAQRFLDAVMGTLGDPQPQLAGGARKRLSGIPPLSDDG